jgi:hypothetical protein
MECVRSNTATGIRSIDVQRRTNGRERKEERQRNKAKGRKVKKTKIKKETKEIYITYTFTHIGKQRSKESREEINAKKGGKRRRKPEKKMRNYRD